MELPWGSIGAAEILLLMRLERYLRSRKTIWSPFGAINNSKRNLLIWKLDSTGLQGCICQMAVWNEHESNAQLNDFVNETKLIVVSP